MLNLFFTTFLLGGINIIPTKNNITIMQILNRKGHIKLLYNNKILRKRKSYKTKAGEKSYYFYMAYLPVEIESYIGIKDKNIFFYEDKGKVLITSKEPEGHYEKVILQKGNQFSLPRRIFTEITEEDERVILTLDLGVKDPYTKQEGLLSIKLE